MACIGFAILWMERKHSAKMIKIKCVKKAIQGNGNDNATQPTDHRNTTANEMIQREQKKTAIAGCFVDYADLYGSFGGSISSIVLLFNRLIFVCLCTFLCHTKAFMDFFFYSLLFYCRILCCVLIWHFRLFLLFE